ncbi:DNA replication factor Cdt1 [Bacillus rossius redtenbacheri]|uniref:DNA replication factor Cdt1 n=1 Tax=Bacillus rossius redtenbacheri TaxID=93214 RepID=UPI002FDE3488
MSQVTITNFFSKRKRHVDDIKSRSKVLVLERELSATYAVKTELLEKTSSQSDALLIDSEKLIPSHKSKEKLQSSRVFSGKKKVRFDESKNTARANNFQKRSGSNSKSPKYDIRKSFQTVSTKIHCGSNDGDCNTGLEDNQLEEIAVASEGPGDVPVLSENAALPAETISGLALGAGGSGVVGVEARSIPGTPTVDAAQAVPVASEVPVLPEDAVPQIEARSGPELTAGSSGVDMRGGAGLMTPTKKTSQAVVDETPCASPVLLGNAVPPTGTSPGPQLAAGSSGAESSLMTPTKKSAQELSLSEIKSRLSRSEKLKKAMNAFSKSSARCAQLEAARKALDKTIPQLQNFEKVEVEFHTSPRKAVQGTPEKRGVLGSSPQKRAVPGSSPQKAPGLPLPFPYRGLAEVFRCVDVVVSMLYNRSEAVTFKKVKAAVQEMLHRTFTEQHLGQIKAVFPDAYIFHQEKVRNFGSTSKADTYELTITPILSSKWKNDNSLHISDEDVPKPADKVLMTPTSILERKRIFYNNLLERVFEQHEKFLSSLDPPLVVPRSELARWHPQFEVDAAEEVAPQELPQPPNVRKFTSAKDVLDRAKDLFSCNQRMQNVLLGMSGDASKAGGQSAVSAAKDSSVAKPDSALSSPAQSALKGIPKSLLEKVRAKQAARARLAMMCPAQDTDSREHGRLPELARILRNMFVTERKVALPLESAVLKLQNSYREKLTARELEHHVRLMVGLLPGWIMIHTIGDADYLKLSRHGDMTKVIQKLEATAAAKRNNTPLLKPA